MLLSREFRSKVKKKREWSITVDRNFRQRSGALAAVLVATLSLPWALAERTGGSNAVVSGITHTAASFSASIVSDSAGTGSYSLAFFFKESSESSYVGIFATPASVAVNANATTTFTASTAQLACGKTYAVTGTYLPPGATQYLRTGTGDTTFSTLPCATITPASTSLKYFTGSAITPATLTAANFNGNPSFSISPALPAGLSFNNATGAISGTPTLAKAATTHTITGTGAISGSASTTITLTVAPALSDLEVLNYVASQSDLIDAFGTNIARARQHWLDWGYNEGRKITFEPLYYTASHPDLMAAFGIDETRAVTHYIQWGFKEKRQVTFSALQSLRYIASQPDLIDAFGADATKGVRHYIQAGYKEGRRITFDPLRYTASHADLISAFGGDETKAATHYIQAGYKEKRQTTFSDLDALSYIASYADLITSLGANAVAGIRNYVETGYQAGRRIVFDALAYIASQSDLIAAFGTDATAGVTHYINWGYKEGRKVVFDALGYLAAHSDLRSAFGTDTSAATKHYINWGFKEGRGYLWTVSATAGTGGQVSAARSYVNTGEKVALTVTPLSGYATTSVTGCGGTLSGTTYTTAPITGTCAISASFKLVTIAGALAADCVGSNCAAVNATTYAGSGIGVWRYTNTSTTLPATLNIALSGVSAGNSVTLLFSNGGKTTAPSLPSTGVAASASASLSPLEFAQDDDSAPTEEIVDPRDAAHWKILESNRNLIATLRATRQNAVGTDMETGFAAPPMLAEAPALGSQKTWKDAAFGAATDYTTSVRATCSASSGRVIVFWVDDQAWSAGKVTSSIIDKFKSAYCGTTGGYERLVKLYGEPWGSHSYSNLISDSPTLQDLNVVMVPSTESYAGYFWGVNAFKDNSKSNTALVFFINSSQFSGDNTPSSTTNFYIGTLVHEMTHMVNYYQREIRRSASHDTWLEETSAMMSEDIITPALTGYNKIETDRMPTYLRAGGDVSYINWPELSGNHYAIGGSFAAFMNRRYGLSFFKALQTCSSDSYGCVDSFINLNGGGGFASEFARMGASMFSLLPGSGLPSQYGFPARTDGDYTLGAINVSSYASRRPSAGPTLGSGYRATSQTFVAETVGSGKTTYVRNEVLVPAGTSLTVIVK